MSKFARYAWGVLGFNILVILWGAYVRATGSGAGCGAHWPLCNGEVIPRSQQLETMVEFAHRLTSGVALLLVIGLVISAWRIYPATHRVRKGAGLSVFFMLLEALIGAVLVLFEWVAHNQSVGRVISISLHLVNTFLLLASLTVTAWWASGGSEVNLNSRSVLLWLFVIGFAGVILLGISGAITALGDTLFPSASLMEGVRQDFQQTAHFLVRLRIWHPVLAVGIGLYTVFLSIMVALEKSDPLVRKFAWLMIGCFLLQLIAGLINLLLLAPIPTQLIHLLLADMVWIVFVLFAAVTFRKLEYSPI